MEYVIEQTRKAILEYSILLLISKADLDVPGLANQLKEKGLIKGEGILYPVLASLSETGILKYRQERSTHGLVKKHYSLTDAGWATLRELNLNWDELVNTIMVLREKEMTDLNAGYGI